MTTPQTDMHVEKGLLALEEGKLKEAKIEFEYACKEEEKAGKIPSQNPEIIYLLQNILAVECLAAIQETKPESFNRIKDSVSTNTYGICIP